MTDLRRQLQQLPDFDPPPGGWPQLQRRLQRPAPSRRLPALAAAASVALAVGLASWMPRELQQPIPPAQQAAPAASSDLDRLMLRSRQLEQQLAELRPRVPVWDGGLAARAAALENGLQVVDLQLAYTESEQAPDQARQLWRNRVQLMDALVQTHARAVLNPDLPTASSLPPENQI